MKKPSGFECNFVHFIFTKVSGNAILLRDYLPPGFKAESFSSFIDYTTEWINYTLIQYRNAAIYVTGDFNRYDLQFLTRDYNLENIVNVPTFCDVVLDKFFCPGDLNSRFNVTTAPGLGNSTYSHRIVVILYGTPINIDVHFHKVYDWRKSLVDLFCDTLRATDGSFMCNSDDWIELWNSAYGHYTY